MAKKPRKDELKNFLDAHYLSEEKANVLAILKELSLYDSFNQSVIQLGKSADLKVIAFHTLRAVNLKLEQIKKPQKKKYENHLIDLCYRILLDYFKVSPLTARQFVGTLENSLKTNCELNDWNYSRLSELFDFPRMRFILEQIPKKILVPNCPYLVWEKKGDLNLLITELVEKRKIAETKSDLEKLFQFEKHPQTRIRWKREEDHLLVWLFSELNQRDYISIRGRNALFVVLERQFVDFSGKPFSNKTLRNKCSFINKNGQDHKHITEDVEKILSLILLNGKPVQGQ